MPSLIDIHGKWANQQNPIAIAKILRNYSGIKKKHLKVTFPPLKPPIWCCHQNGDQLIGLMPALVGFSFTIILNVFSFLLIFLFWRYKNSSSPLSFSPKTPRSIHSLKPIGFSLPELSVLNFSELKVMVTSNFLSFSSRYSTVSVLFSKRVMVSNKSSMMHWCESGVSAFMYFNKSLLVG